MRDVSGSIVGVLDLLDGVVVRAIAGERHRYRPWRSPLTDSSDPLAIARAFREHYNITELYVADLNGLLGRGGSPEVVRQLVAAGFRVTLDAGPRDARQIAAALDTGAESVVLPLETLPHRSRLLDWIGEFDRRRLAFGLDLIGGRPMAEPRVWEVDGSDASHRGWSADAPRRIAGDVLSLGIPRVIVLELHAVGGQAGPRTAGLCRQLRRDAPAATIWTGGGARHLADVLALRAAGADRVLAATALHERSLT